MKFEVYVVDAFTNKLFGGNPAAVCPLENWLPDNVMQKLALENNLSDTAFFVKNDTNYHIRWFTPVTEVKLCGHATLATAHIIFTELGYTNHEIIFDSLSGNLKASRMSDRKIQLDFPSNPPKPINEVPAGIFGGLGVKNAKVFKTSFEYMVVLPSQKDIEMLQPDFKTLANVDCRGIITTAKGDESDFVSRCFYPQIGIDEDPVTGSAHTLTVPYWADQLGRTNLKAIQLSKRRGYLDCELEGNRVLIRGDAVTYMKGEYYLKMESLK